MEDQNSPIPMMCYHYKRKGVVYGMLHSQHARFNGHGSVLGFECDFSGDYYLGHKVQWGLACIDHWL